MEVEEEEEGGAAASPNFADATDFVLLLKKWQEIHSLGGRALKKIHSSLCSLNDGRRDTPKEIPTVLEKLLEEVKTAKLEEYIQRGCTSSADATYWLTAEEMNSSFQALHAARGKCIKIVEQLEQALDKVSAEYAGIHQYDREKMERFESTLYIMAVLVEGVQKEMNVMNRVTDAVQIDTKVDELQTYCLVWDLQPYLDPELIQKLSDLSSSDTN